MNFSGCIKIVSPAPPLSRWDQRKPTQAEPEKKCPCIGGERVCKGLQSGELRSLAPARPAAQTGGRQEALERIRQPCKSIPRTEAQKHSPETDAFFHPSRNSVKCKTLPSFEFVICPATCLCIFKRRPPFPAGLGSNTPQSRS